MPEPRKTNGWNEWSRHVLAELERLNLAYEGLREDNTKEHGDIREAISLTKAEIAVLKVKSGLWGAAAGFVPAAIAIIWMIMSK